MPKVLGIKTGAISGEDALHQSGKYWFRNKALKITYLILSDSLNDDEEVILATSGVPPLFYPMRGMYCKSRSPVETEQVIHPETGVKASIWEVTCEFTSEVTPSDNVPPESRTPVVRWYGETEEEVLERDAVNGVPVTTINREPLLVTTPVVYPILEIQRYEYYPFNPNVMLAYANHVNADYFWGAAPGSALMLPMTVDEETILVNDTPTKYAVVTYRIKFKIRPGLPNPWMARVLHQGTLYRETAGGPISVYTDRYGNTATVNLNTDGTKLPDGSNPIYREFNRFYPAYFNYLSLGPF